jgi:hypothetical protein
VSVVDIDRDKIYGRMNCELRAAEALLLGKCGLFSSIQKGWMQRVFDNDVRCSRERNRRDKQHHFRKPNRESEFAPRVQGALECSRNALLTARSAAFANGCDDRNGINSTPSICDQRKRGFAMGRPYEK